MAEIKLNSKEMEDYTLHVYYMTKNNIVGSANPVWVPDDKDIKWAAKQLEKKFGSEGYVFDVYPVVKL